MLSDSHQSVEDILAPNGYVLFRDLSVGDVFLAKSGMWGNFFIVVVSPSTGEVILLSDNDNAFRNPTVCTFEGSFLRAHHKDLKALRWPKRSPSVLLFDSPSVLFTRQVIDIEMVDSERTCSIRERLRGGGIVL